tara:strand:+ start:256 stop:768 length:513 start_codon:yes stop_codon:yes gene_type:complete
MEENATNSKKHWSQEDMRMLFNDFNKKLTDDYCEQKYGRPLSACKHRMKKLVKFALEYPKLNQKNRDLNQRVIELNIKIQELQNENVEETETETETETENVENYPNLQVDSDIETDIEERDEDMDINENIDNNELHKLMLIKMFNKYINNITNEQTLKMADYLLKNINDV